MQTFNFKKIKKKLEKHLESGGSSKNIVLAGVAGTSEQTMCRWLNSSNSNFNDDISQTVNKYRAAAALKTDEMHKSASFGGLDMKNVDSRSLNIRYKEQVVQSENVQLSAATKKAFEGDDTKLQLACLRKDLARRKITLDQFEQISKTLVQSSDVDIKELQEMFKDEGLKLDLSPNERTKESWGFLVNKGSEYAIYTYHSSTSEERKVLIERM